MIEDAIRSGLPPAKLPATPETGVSMNISFKSIEDRVIRSLATGEGIAQSEAAQRFLLAAIARGDAINHQIEASSGDLPRFLAAAGRSERHGQNTFYNCLMDSLSGNKIGMVEGATGLGKTLAMIAAAATTLKQAGFGRAVITAPSLQILGQFVRQHRGLETLDGMPGCRPIVGRQEFVSQEALTQVLMDGEILVDPDPICEWMSAGGPPSGNGKFFGHNYLCDSLLEVSRDFPVDIVRLTSVTSKEDPGAVAYSEQFTREESGTLGTEILYCTHAMMGVDIRRRMAAARNMYEGSEFHSESIQAAMRERAGAKTGDEHKRIGKEMVAQIKANQEALAELASENDIGHLPPWQHLIVDEAHAFESHLAAGLSSYLSVKSFRSDLDALHKKGILSAAALSRANIAVKELRACGADSDDDLNLADTNDGNTRRARAALSELADAFCSAHIKKSIPNGPLLDRVRRTAAELKMSVQSASMAGMLSLVRFSPIQQYPQVFLGRKSIDRELGFLWATTTSAVCVSATLYLRRLDADSASYYRLIMAIPKERVVEYPPIRPSWVVAPVTGLWVPESVTVEGRLWLRPPTRADKLTAAQTNSAEAQWLEEIANAIRYIHQSSAGGTLVLMTAYDAIKHLVTLLGNDIPHKVVASRGSDNQIPHTLAEQRRMFIEMASDGRRPVWFALGNAWTGLDVNGDDLALPAEHDNLLTDLVIPKIPFSLNRTMTHHHRAATQNKVPWELLDTSMRLKQGLGRLVRREGLPHNRRIFMLDGRVNDRQFDGYFSALNRIMGIYPAKRLVRSGTVAG